MKRLSCIQQGIVLHWPVRGAGIDAIPGNACLMVTTVAGFLPAAVVILSPGFPPLMITKAVRSEI